MPRKSRSINYFMGGAEGQPSPAANTRAPGANTRAPGANNRGKGVNPANNSGTTSNTRVNMETPVGEKKGVMGTIAQYSGKVYETGRDAINTVANTVNDNVVEPIRRTAGLSSAQPAQPEPTPTPTPSQPDASTKEEGNKVMYYILIAVCVIIIIALIYYIYKVYFVTEKYKDKEEEDKQKLNSFKDFDENNLSRFTIDDANDIIKIF
jgi:cell division protein FtsL